MKILFKYLIVFVGLLLSSSSIAQEQIDLFILAGQSNAQGWKGNAASYPSDPNNLDAQIRLNSTFIDDSNTGGWVTMQAQSGRYTAGHFGPEVSFSRKLKQAGYNPAIFKFSKGATSLYDDWKQPGAGGHYDAMVTALRIAIIELENLGHTVNIKCFIWIQGQKDAKNVTASSAYEANLLNLINDLRTNVVYNSSLPMLLGVDDVNGGDVLNIQKNIAINDNNILFTSMLDLPKSDTTHLTPAGLIAHGEVVFDDYEATFINIGTECPISIPETLEVIAVDESWGKSFVANCSGNITSVSFNSPTVLNGGVTLLIKDGPGSDASTIHTQNIAAVVNGNNIASIIGNVDVTDGNTYYFQIVSFGCPVSVSGVLDVITTDESWGKSFVATCSGNITSVGFNSPTALSEGIILLIKDGQDANATTLHTQSLTEVVDGDNTVSIIGNVAITDGNTYYFQIESEKVATSCSSTPVVPNKPKSGLVNLSWGQSFEAGCSGALTSITFNSGELLASGATLYVKDGANGSATTLHSEAISVVVGDNQITLSSVVPVTFGNMYYFQVVGNNGERFSIAFSSTNQVAGNLSTHLDATTDPLAYDRGFGNYDWAFLLEIDTVLSVAGVSSSLNKPNLYPNPATNNFTITKSKNASLEVYDVVGGLVLKTEIKTDKESIDIRHFNSGIYFVRIKNNGVVFSTKIIKE